MNTFGNILRLTTFGESHGIAVGGVIDGFPAGFTLDVEDINHKLFLRSPKNAVGATSRQEQDEVEFLSGIYDGKTLGSPIAFLIRNKNVISDDYDNIADVYRPGHADYTYQMRYGIRDYRGGGRSSARETISRVVAGAIAEQWLNSQKITLVTFVDKIGNINLPKQYVSQSIDNSPLRCPDKITEDCWKKLIDKVSADGDTIGGCVKCIIKGMPAGIGEPIFDKIQSHLAAAMMSIPAAKGFEYGTGMHAAELKGSENNDEMCMKDGKIVFKTNNAGGLLGGITTGEDIFFRVAFKPVSSIKKPQNTINDKGEIVNLNIIGRHDVCVAPRAASIVRAMASLVIMDQILLRKNH